MGIAICDEVTCQFKNPATKTEDKKEEKLSAWFDGLVDLVLDDNGKVCFLIKENNSLCLKEGHELSDSILIPPSAEFIVWQVPRSSEVLKYVTGDSDIAI